MVYTDRVRSVLLIPALALTAPAPRLAPALPAPAFSAPVPALAFSPAPLPLSAPSTPAPAPESRPAIASFFDGVRPAGSEEGAPVRARREPSPGATYGWAFQLQAIRETVEAALPALRESVALGGWLGPSTTLDSSCCGDAAPKLAVLLRARGIPVRLVEAELHYYLILDLPGGQVVVDPTIRQFFGRADAPRDIPQVFVGTTWELQALFHRQAGFKRTRYSAPRLYFSEAVVRERKVAELEAAVREGSSAEHAPLRRFLGLPTGA